MQHPDEFNAPFEEYNFITQQIAEESPLTAHMHLLCPRETWVFVFKTRTWGNQPGLFFSYYLNSTDNEHRKGWNG